MRPCGHRQWHRKRLPWRLRAQRFGDLAQVFIQAQRDGLGYNLAHIPADFAETPRQPFDRDYMRKLFLLGREQAVKGHPWRVEGAR